jgi:hypothetical protein
MGRAGYDATCGVVYWWTRPKASAPLGPPSASPTTGAVRLAPPGQLPGRRGGSIHHGALVIDIITLSAGGCGRCEWPRQSLGQMANSRRNRNFGEPATRM